jgi:RNA polymerase sigma factor (TIGR02999 family)
MPDITRLLDSAAAGDPRAAADLLPLVYGELRRLAAARMAAEAPGQTLTATALVHEAYLRLVGGDPDRPWNGRGHFFAAAAEAMRRILVERARRGRRHRHGGGRRRLPLDPDQVASPPGDDDLLVVHDALDRLAAEDPQAAQLVKLRYFAGLSVEQAAEALGLPRSSAYLHWAFARATLRVLLRDHPDPPGA